MPNNRQAIVASEGGQTTESALVVPVPEAESVAGDLRARYDPAAPAGVPAHITVLYPFLPPPALDQSIIDELQAIFSGVTPFEFRLPRIALFPDVVYLPPDPVEPFLRLTAAIATRWPETPPYGGQFDQVIPHLTVAHTEDASTIADIRRKIEPALPIVCSAAQAWLFANRGEQWTVEQRFPFEGPGSR
jgi:hypothetical protein